MVEERGVQLSATNPWFKASVRVFKLYSAFSWLLSRNTMSRLQKQKITDVKQMTNTSILVDRLLSVCSQTVDRYIGQRMFLCNICALEHLCTNRQPNIRAQTVDKYYGWPFVVREMLICNLHINSNKRYRCIWKALLSLRRMVHYNTPLKLVCLWITFTVCCIGQ